MEYSKCKIEINVIIYNMYMTWISKNYLQMVDPVIAYSVSKTKPWRNKLADDIQISKLVDVVRGMIILTNERVACSFNSNVYISSNKHPLSPSVHAEYGRQFTFDFISLKIMDIQYRKIVNRQADRHGKM